MRFLLTTLVILVFALQTPAEDASRQPDDLLEEPPPAQDPIETLNVSVDFKKAPIDEVLEFLAKAGCLEFVLSKGVRDELADGRMKVDLKLNDLPVKSVLKLFSNLLDLSIVLTDGTLMVETTEERRKERKRVEIDVRDLLVEIPDFPGPSPFPEENAKEPPTDECAVLAEESMRRRHPNKFVDLIASSTRSYAAWGQDGASISLKDGVLIVVNNSEVIEEVQELLSALRQFR